eukprot:COSAG06_NODE_63549_length_262_cov_0.625767_2_plen_29_part_01
MVGFSFAFSIAMPGNPAFDSGGVLGPTAG